MTDNPQTTLKFSELRCKAILFANLSPDTPASFSKIVHDMPYECRLGLAEDMARYCEENAHD
jgi:hypothetical protein